MPDPAYQPGRPPQRPPDPYRPAVPAAEVDVRQQDGFVPTLIPYRNPKALIAYYLGVFALIPCLGALLGPAALVLGILGLGAVKRHPQAKGTGHAITGIVLGALALLFNWVAIPVFIMASWAASKR